MERKPTGSRTFRLFLLVAALLPSGAAWAAPAQTTLPPEATKVATDFLYAFSRSDGDTMSKMVPEKLADRYGPCPFSRVPTLSKPCADTTIGTIRFTGPSVDPTLPAKGVISLHKESEDGRTVWRVRQIFWYNELPPKANLPESSPTAADRKQEHAIEEATRRFLTQWMSGDYQGLDRHVAYWWKRNRKPSKYVKATGVEVERAVASLGGVRVDARATVKVVGVITRRVDGTLWLVKVDGVWKVRPLTLAFFF
jgi:hypothetical protein